MSTLERLEFNTIKIFYCGYRSNKEIILRLMGSYVCDHYNTKYDKSSEKLIIHHVLL